MTPVQTSTAGALRTSARKRRGKEDLNEYNNAFRVRQLSRRHTTAAAACGCRDRVRVRGIGAGEEARQRQGHLRGDRTGAVDLLLPVAPLGHRDRAGAEDCPAIA